MGPRLASALVILLTILSLVTVSECQGAWQTGRATFYGTDDWSIHRGGCNYGNIYQSENLGWDVAAITDVNPYYPDSCGTCYEVSCNPIWISDNYGGSFDRTYTCYDSSASVVVRITDVCPCTYPANAGSNKRWCCGDMTHFDVSIWVFEKLADPKYGVIGLKYRPVPCDYKPDSPAPAIPYPSTGVHPPLGTSPPTRDWPELLKNTIDWQQIIFRQGYQPGVTDGSWYTWVQPLSDSVHSGMLSKQGLCAKINKGGALAFNLWQGAFNQRISLEFWVYVGVTGWEGMSTVTPNLHINIAGVKGGCSPQTIHNFKPNEFQPTCVPYCSDYFFKYEIYLPTFNEESKAPINDGNVFQGCGGNGVNELNQVQFRNDWGDNDMWVCFDHIQLN